MLKLLINVNFENKLNLSLYMVVEVKLNSNKGYHFNINIGSFKKSNLDEGDKKEDFLKFNFFIPIILI